MADFLTAVKTTVRKESEKQPEAVLTALSSRQIQDVRPKKSNKKVQLISDDGVKTAEASASSKPIVLKVAATSEDALQMLRSQPDTESLLHTLISLQPSDAFSLHTPGPIQAQIISTLINDTVPAFWSTLQGKDRTLLLSCLRTVAGANAIIARIRLLSESAGKSSAELSDLIVVANELFAKDDFALTIWSGLFEAVPEEVKRKLAWKEFVNLIGSGKIIATVARAEDSLKAVDATVKQSWLTKGGEYAVWLGRSIARIASISSTDSPATVRPREEAAAQFLQKGFALGYSIPLIKAFFTDVVEHSPAPLLILKGLCSHLPEFSRRQYLETTLQWLSSMTQDSMRLQDSSQQNGDVRAISGLMFLVLNSGESFAKHLLTFLGDPPLASSLSEVVRRACLAALDASSSDEVQNLLEKSMASFGDSLFINHAPIIQQESLAQSLLISAGYVHRRSPGILLTTARSSSHMQGVSRRLDSTNSKARWLGMIVGTAVSTLVDKEGSQMNFGTDELDTDEGRWYLQLVKVEDKVGSLPEVEAFLKSKHGALTTRRKPNVEQRLPLINGKPVYGPPRPPVVSQTEVVGEKISEILDDEREDDDLKPYAKPDSDPEDSDEDATLVQRNKPRPPVYIRDLMRMLHDDKDAARFQLGITHAATLIRRKAAFGREVTDHAEELASMLCNLQDPFSTDDFDELRLQGLIAILLADVKNMAPWLGGQAFVGDYSISQRCIMLSALGLGGRELAGLKNLDELAPVPGGTSFPSKKLPGRLHAVYNPNSSIKTLEKATASLEHNLIAPLAMSAADKTTQHLDAVKVRTFSSRMEVQARTKRNAPANSLAKCFSETFFAPLIGRYQQEIAAYGQGSIYATTPFLLVTFLKTLALLLHAAGPATTNLGDVVSVFWGVLLGLRVKAGGDVSVLEAVLFSMLTILEVVGESVGGKERLAREFPRELEETKMWVEGVFERTGSGGLVEEGGGDEGRVRRLAAGVLVRIGEVGEAWQKSLIGRM